MPLRAPLLAEVMSHITVQQPPFGAAMLLFAPPLRLPAGCCDSWYLASLSATARILGRSFGSCAQQSVMIWRSTSGMWSGRGLLSPLATCTVHKAQCSQPRKVGLAGRIALSAGSVYLHRGFSPTSIQDTCSLPSHAVEVLVVKSVTKDCSWRMWLSDWREFIDCKDVMSALLEVTSKIMPIPWGSHLSDIIMTGSFWEFHIMLHACLVHATQ